MESVIKEYWALFAAAAAHIAWLVRLESRVHSNTKDQRKTTERSVEAINELKREWSERRKEDMAILAQQRREDAESRHKDWETLRGDMQEMKADIKKLLSHMG
jgi:Sec-independent protein translocase protein TatA